MKRFGSASLMSKEKGLQSLQPFFNLFRLDFLLTQRDSFYMATVGNNGFPYIQFRGDPKGFLKGLDDRRLGLIDFRGNMQIHFDRQFVYQQQGGVDPD